VASELIGKLAPGGKDHHLETLDFPDDGGDDETIDDIRRQLFGANLSFLNTLLMPMTFS
jgi:hypothetical protein